MPVTDMVTRIPKKVCKLMFTNSFFVLGSFLVCPASIWPVNLEAYNLEILQIFSLSSFYLVTKLCSLNIECECLTWLPLSNLKIS